MSLEEEQEQKRQDAERKRIAAQSISEVEDWKDKKSLEEGFFELAKGSFRRGIQGVLTAEPRMMTEGFTAGILFLTLKLAELGIRITYKVVKDTIKVALEAQRLSKRSLNKINENLSSVSFIEEPNNLMEKLSDDFKSELAEKGIDAQKLSDDLKSELVKEGIDAREMLLQVALEELEKSENLSDRPPTYEQATGKKAMRVFLPNEKYFTDLPKEKHSTSRDNFMIVDLPENKSLIKALNNTTTENNSNKLANKKIEGNKIDLSGNLKGSSFENSFDIPFSELEKILTVNEGRIKRLKNSFAKMKLNNSNQYSL